MAKPITLEILPRDPRRKLISRLESAPVEHAEAILSAYELLQNLHDQHILELLRGLLGSEGKVLEIITDAAKQPEAIRGIRNLVILAKTFGTIDPEVLKNIAGAIPEAMQRAKAEAPNPPGLWALLKQFRRKDSRRGLLVVNNLLEAWGRNLSLEEKGNPK
jgi:uncharacterized protein YjgD (DUF1641 family)